MSSTPTLFLTANMLQQALAGRALNTVQVSQRATGDAKTMTTRTLEFSSPTGVYFHLSGRKVIVSRTPVLVLGETVLVLSVSSRAYPVLTDPSAPTGEEIKTHPPATPQKAVSTLLQTIAVHPDRVPKSTLRMNFEGSTLLLVDVMRTKSAEEKTVTQEMIDNLVTRESHESIVQKILVKLQTPVNTNTPLAVMMSNTLGLDEVTISESLHSLQWSPFLLANDILCDENSKNLLANRIANQIVRLLNVTEPSNETSVYRSNRPGVMRVEASSSLEIYYEPANLTVVSASHDIQNRWAREKEARDNRVKGKRSSEPEPAAAAAAPATERKPRASGTKKPRASGTKKPRASKKTAPAPENIDDVADLR